VLAQAVRNLFPEVKLAIGPAIKDGFYYDFDREERFTDEDLRRLEAEMQKIIDERQPFKHYHVTKAEAQDRFTKLAETYKLEILEGLEEGQITFVENGPFIDLCRGNHIESTGEVKAFKLLSIAGAYWRGNENNKMLQRIYGTAFFSAKEQAVYLNRLEEAKKRDHRKIGKELDLFSFHDESPAMVFFHEKGFFLFNSLIDYLRKQLKTRGYQEVQAPTILSDDLWKKSGHYDNFHDAMYFTKAENREYAVKPMNCPGHALIYKTSQRSYRELPVRIAEFGKVHRYERSGATHGLMRVRAFTQDDAHHFCTEDQLQSEIVQLIDFTDEVYKKFGFDHYEVAVSTKPQKAMGSDEIWDKATSALTEALKSRNIPFTINEGEGAFYGPKIEFVIYDSIGRAWQCGTIQVDFSMPERFDLEYVSSDSSRKRPVMIHRAIYGSLERFLGILIEHYAGAFPLWLAPVQVRVLTIAEQHAEAAGKIIKTLQAAGFRAEEDFRSEKIGYKIREAELQKTPFILVLGDKEVESGKVAVRKRGKQDLGTQSIDDFLALLKSELAELSVPNPR